MFKGIVSTIRKKLGFFSRENVYKKRKEAVSSEVQEPERIQRISHSYTRKHHKINKPAWWVRMYRLSKRPKAGLLSPLPSFGTFSPVKPIYPFYAGSKKKGAK